MKPDEALKKINEALDEDITDIVLLGKVEGGKMVVMNVGDTESSANLLMNYLEDNQDVKYYLLKTILLHDIMKKAMSEVGDENE